MDGNTFVEFEDKPSPTDVTTDHHAYLIHDFPGYWYGGETYYRSNEARNGVNMKSGATRIQPRLVWKPSTYLGFGSWSEPGPWQYRNYNSNTWSNVDDGSHIYLVYDKKAQTSQGGKPTVYEFGDGNEPPAPKILKGSESNSDGTNTLSLSITGHTAAKAMEKLADVVILLDVSGSMNENMNGDEYDSYGREIPVSQRRLYYAKEAINQLADDLLTRVNPDGEKLVRMGLVTFSTSAENQIALTDDLDEFKDQVDDLTANGGTNWEKALNLANQMTVASDRATFVIFVTDGDPTFRMRRMGTTDAELYNDLFGYDGADNYYLSDYVYGRGDTDIYNRNYDGAVDEAKTIVANKKTLYTVGIANDSSNLGKFSNEVGAARYFTSENSQDILNAFADIGRFINAKTGQSDIQMTDGITHLTNTVEKSGMLQLDGNFQYWKAPAPANWSTMTEEQKAAYTPAEEGFTEWDPASEKCAEAFYDKESGAVKWNMGKDFMLEDGVTYKVTFRAWPTQEAYDIIANLNNGVISS